ncbi:MAG: Rnf-Nqr domain containing protein [Phycisphaerae bacterium]
MFDILAQAKVLEAAPTASFLTILMAAAITDNILLTRFLGMCPFLSVSRQLKSAVGMGLAVVFVTTSTTFLNALLYWNILAPRGLATSLQFILFIVMIAAFVQLCEMLIERLSVGLYYSLGIFLPLITVNCAILGSSLFMVNKELKGIMSLGYGFGVGLGWMIAIVLMAGIRQKLSKAKIPAGLEGPGITLIIAGIMALAFMGFVGVIQS